jgi:hypothetical protein
VKRGLLDAAISLSEQSLSSKFDVSANQICSWHCPRFTSWQHGHSLWEDVCDEVFLLTRMALRSRCNTWRMGAGDGAVQPRSNKSAENPADDGRTGFGLTITSVIYRPDDS